MDPDILANEAGAGGDGADGAVRFEDLTVDDDLPFLERMARYTRSQIALQRLVHVKMLGETAELAGMLDTQEVIVPLLPALVSDPESVIRQHLAPQLVAIAMVAMIRAPPPPPQDDNEHEEDTNGNHNNTKIIKAVHPPLIKVQEYLNHPEYYKEYDEEGYAIVTKVIVSQHLQCLVADPDVDVRRAAAEALTALAVQLDPVTQPEDIPVYVLPIPLRLAYEKGPPPPNKASSKNSNNNKTVKNEAAQQAEEMRMTAANLLAELTGALSEQKTTTAQFNNNNNNKFPWVTEHVLPALLQLCSDPTFRVRRAAAQALPRVLGACPVEAVADHVLPAFERLSQDDLYRVRKSTGECLVDMSRSMMILCQRQRDAHDQHRLQELRREYLIPIADRLIQDEHKMVRQGMMQFLGPFMASFYPFQDSTLQVKLPATSESDGSNHTGIVAQFFPHATSMVSRLNSAQNAVSNAPAPILTDRSRPYMDDWQRLQKLLPLFFHASRLSATSLATVVQHRRSHPPDPFDLDILVDRLLDYFAALAIVNTGDENTDAEMRVYCAYSFPAIVLLLGPENWEGAMKTCFFTLLNPSFAADEDDDEAAAHGANNGTATEPPLPVKRCLASSLHTIAHILGPEITATDILPIVKDYFIRDADESVRLNIIRGFASFLSALPNDERRTDLLYTWSEIVNGEDCLGAKKRSATNPLVLNWRQRNYLARSLPELLCLVSPDAAFGYLWPILKELILDSVSLVREDAMWSIPMLLKLLCPETVAMYPEIEDPKRFSSECLKDVLTWLKHAILKQGGLPKGAQRRSQQQQQQSYQANFSDRQYYCRVCASVGLAIRFNEEIQKLTQKKKEQVSHSFGESFKQFLFGSVHAEDLGKQTGPFQRMSTAEHKFLRRILFENLLPAALEMKSDRISNVRVTLMKSLQIMPKYIQDAPPVKPVLKELEEEVDTWESFGEEDAPMAAPPKPRRVSHPAAMQQSERVSHSPPQSPRRLPSDKQLKIGPVDVDDVQITPSNSKDEEDADSARGETALDASTASFDMSDDLSDPEKKAKKREKKKKKKREKEKEKERSSSKLSPKRDESKKTNETRAVQATSLAVGDGPMNELPSVDSGNNDSFEKAWEDDDEKEEQKVPAERDKANRRQSLTIDPITHLSDDDADLDAMGIPEEPSLVPHTIQDHEAQSRAMEDAYNAAQEAVNARLSAAGVQETTSGAENEEEEQRERVTLSTFSVASLPSLPSTARQKSPTKRHKKKGSPSRGGSKPQTPTSTDAKKIPSPAGSPIKKVTPLTIPDLENAPIVVANMSEAEKLAGWVTVIFQDGPIGLQLEPTAEDRACRVFAFLDTATVASPAKSSGQINIGDVIVKVNGTAVRSYDETIDILKRGGQREITFRPGTASDDFFDDSVNNDSLTDDGNNSGKLEDDDDDEEEEEEEEEDEEEDEEDEEEAKAPAAAAAPSSSSSKRSSKKESKKPKKSKKSSADKEKSERKKKDKKEKKKKKEGKDSSD